MLYLFAIFFGLGLSIAMGIGICLDRDHSQGWGDFVSLFVLNPIIFVLGTLLVFSYLPPSVHEAMDRRMMKTECQARVWVLIWFLLGLISAYAVLRFF